VPRQILPSPHVRYSAVQHVRRAFGSEAAAAWIAAAQSALDRPHMVQAPFAADGMLSATTAQAWRFSARRGHRIVVDVAFADPPAFIDLFREDGATVVASAASGSSHLQYDVDRDGDVLLRVQPAIDEGGAFALKAGVDASLTFPVYGVPPQAVGSTFGAGRDSGRRRHAGVDIFAPRGTAVLAAADGWVRGSTTNNLGGKVVWIWSPLRRLSTYYAHLDDYAVSSGDWISAGEVVGYVGTTGNARGTPPHLHFGVYPWGAGAVDPLPYLRPDPAPAAANRTRRSARH
jgi:murein DD-endopeptidase MepM/ murein hydrolase activator NlpD